MFLADLLAVALTCEGFLHTLLFAWFQIKRVTLDFLDDVFGLNLPLEAAKGILKGLAFLNSNLCQDGYTSKPSQSMVNFKDSTLWLILRGNFIPFS